jgi:hypothetical protein
MLKFLNFHRPDIRILEVERNVEGLINAIQYADDNKPWWSTKEAHKVRQSAAEALGQLGDVRAVEPLIAALKDPELEVRKAVIKSLGQLGDVRAVELSLATGWWEDADTATKAVMLKRADCETLRTIDQLWVKYSNGKFGFSIQKQIWLDCGGKLGEFNLDALLRFGDRVGWIIRGGIGGKGSLPHVPFDIYALVTARNEGESVCGSYYAGPGDPFNCGYPDPADYENESNWQDSYVTVDDYGGDLRAFIEGEKSLVSFGDEWNKIALFYHHIEECGL